MPKIPKPPAVAVMAEEVYRTWQDRERKENGGVYPARLGASSVGRECVREVWLSWRMYYKEDFPGRILRLFETGHLQEDRILADLRAAEYAVWSHTEHGKQYAYTDDTGHFVVKLDGVIKGVPTSPDVPYVLEIKTHSDKSYREVVKKGVEKAKPEHYLQMQAGMRYSGIPQALYVALNKNDENYYFEVVYYNPVEAACIEQRIQTLVNASIPPVGVSEDGTGYACRYCAARACCVKEVPPLRNCRTCANVSPGPEGIWYCELSREALDIKAQQRGCSHYEVLI